MLIISPIYLNIMMIRELKTLEHCQCLQILAMLELVLSLVLQIKTLDGMEEPSLIGGSLLRRKLNLMLHIKLWLILMSSTIRMVMLLVLLLLMRILRAIPLSIVYLLVRLYNLTLKMLVMVLAKMYMALLKLLRLKMLL